MNEIDALLYAQKIWGAGPYNAKVKRVGKKHRVGRHMGKTSWILGEGASWEEAFRNYWQDILDYRKREYAYSPATALGGLTKKQYQDSNAKIADALAKGELPTVPTV